MLGPDVEDDVALLAVRMHPLGAQRPAARIMPVSSRSETKREGGTTPRSGSFQRISASSPARVPVATLILGW